MRAAFKARRRRRKGRSGWNKSLANWNTTIPQRRTLQRLKIPVSLQKCLATTNLIESPHSGVRKRTQNVCRWRDADMVERWVVSAWLLTEKHFRRIDGHEHLWALA